MSWVRFSILDNWLRAFLVTPKLCPQSEEFYSHLGRRDLALVRSEDG